MACQQVRPILGAKCVMISLRLFWHLSVWILGKPAKFHLLSSLRSLSVELWLVAALKALWMCFCVCVFHLWWSSFVRGSGDCPVVCSLMLVLWICFFFMSWMCCCTVEAMWSWCQLACLAARSVYPD